MKLRHGVVGKCSLLIVFLLFGPPFSFAEITVQPDFQGTVLITFPNGDIALVEKGDPLPEIPPGSTIEVFGGHATVAAGGEDSVKVSCLGHQGVVGGGCSVEVNCGEKSGLFTMLKGTGRVTDQNGNEQALNEGEEYPIEIFPGPATETTGETTPPTAAGEPTGGPPAGGDLGEDPPVDSRSLEASISQ